MYHLLYAAFPFPLDCTLLVRALFSWCFEPGELIIQLIPMAGEQAIFELSKSIVSIVHRLSPVGLVTLACQTSRWQQSNEGLKQICLYLHTWNGHLEDLIRGKGKGNCSIGFILQMDLIDAPCLLYPRIIWLLWSHNLLLTVTKYRSCVPLKRCRKGERLICTLRTPLCPSLGLFLYMTQI